MADLTEFEILLLRKLQEPLAICQRPFDQIAKALQSDEQTVLDAIRRLKAVGIIRRLRANIRYRSLGRIASLVTAHVPDDKFHNVARAVNSLDGVSHNYCRAHHYNLWFTIQAASLIAVDVTLDGLREDFDIAFYSLPAVRLFKLDVRFDPAGPGSISDDCPLAMDVALSDVPPIPVELSPSEKAVLACIQDELPIIDCPFDSFKSPGLKDLLAVIHQLTQKGVLNKISAVLDYAKLGYAANAMFCIEVPEDRIRQAGTELARFSLVSHCYQRQTFAGWPFNLYAMCHAGQMEVIESFAESFCIAQNLPNFQLLPTLAELKKEPVRIKE
jgi:DNA-binding Lrp family transcriptional regulator